MPEAGVRGGGAIREEKARGVPWGTEALHAARLPTGLLVRLLGTVVWMPGLPMSLTGRGRGHGRTLAFELARDNR
jgi:hypothetical protein